MKRLPMKTPEEARRTHAKEIREYKNTPDEEREHTAFSNIDKAFRTQLNYFRLEADLRIEERLQSIEERLDQEADR